MERCKLFRIFQLTNIISFIPKCAIVFCACFSGTLLAEDQEICTAKIDRSGKVPTLEINGKKSRSRMLYVATKTFNFDSPYRREIEKSQNWTNTFFTIYPLSADASNVSLKINTHKYGAEFQIRKLDVVDEESGELVYSFNFSDASIDPESLNGKNSNAVILRENGMLRVKATPKDFLNFGGIDLKKGKKYKIKVSARPLDKTFLMELRVLNQEGRFLAPQENPAELISSQTSLAKNAGIDLVTIMTPAHFYMPEDGKSMNFQPLKKELDMVISANPNAKILLRIRLYPPRWWMDKYADECMTDERGKADKTFPFPASEIYKRDCKKVLKTVIDFCEKNYSKNIFGYHTAGGNSSEWFYGNFWGGRLYGYGKAERAAWQKWVSNKYASDEELKKAWNDETASLKNIEPPSSEERRTQVYIVDPKHSEKVADFNRFLQDSMADSVIELTKFVKDNAPDKLCVIFYGYTQELTRVPKGPAASGHYRLWKLLGQEHIDMISGPISYVRRDFGNGATVMSACETITRKGKIWINEDDSRTYLSPAGQQKITPIGKELSTFENTCKVLARNLGQESVRNITSWWMDLIGVGWFNDAKLWDIMKGFEPIERDMRDNPSVYEPEIALITDEESVMYSGTFGGIEETTKVASELREKINKCASPQGFYLFRDFIDGKSIPAKLAIFPILYALDSKDRAALREKTKDMATIFIWLPGYIDLDAKDFSLDAAFETTGFKFKKVEDKISAMVSATPEGKALGMPDTFGFDKTIEPLLTPIVEASDKVLALYKDGSPAVVLRGNKLFCGVADVPQELVRHMVNISGAKVYSKSPISVFANGAYISATSLDEDPSTKSVEINTFYNGQIFDAISGRKLGNGPVIKLDMKLGDTVMLRLGEGNAQIKNK